jgi:hypothetical protein
MVFENQPAFSSVQVKTIRVRQCFHGTDFNAGRISYHRSTR